MNYSYEMWVRGDSLFEFLTRIRELDKTDPKWDELHKLVWPDGRRLAFVRPANYEWTEDEDLIPFDGSLQKCFCLNLWFEADEALRLYDLRLNELEEWERRRYKERKFPILKADGRYSVGVIYLDIHLSPGELCWIGDEPTYVRVSFVAATSDMSELFANSPSMRSFFRDLARESQAIVCYYDEEGWKPAELLFADPRGTQLPPVYLYEDDVSPEFNRYFPASDTELIRIVKLCAYAKDDREVISEHFQEVAGLTKDRESSLRAKAYVGLQSADDAALPILEAGLGDEDWRVRALAVQSMGYLRGPTEDSRFPEATAHLLQALKDPHPEVRITAVDHLWRIADRQVFEALLDIVENTPTTAENLGLIKRALFGVMLNKSGWNASNTVEKRLLEKDFPFPFQVKQTIERLQAKPDRV